MEAMSESESKNMSDFSTNNGFCLLCLDILPMSGEDKCGKLLNISAIFRNLEANLSENLTDDSQNKKAEASLQLLNLLGKVNRTAEFCEKCAVIISKTLEKFQVLEKVEMELGYYLEMVRNVIVQTGEVRRKKQGQCEERMSNNNYPSGFGTKEIENIMRLRGLLSDKCKEMMSKRAQLVVKVKRMKLGSISNQHTSSKENPKQTDFSQDNLCKPTVKLEPLPCSFMSSVDDEDFSNDYDYEGSSNSRVKSFPKVKFEKQLSVNIEKPLSKMQNSPKGTLIGKHEKRHKCGQCPKYFFAKGSLVRHINAVHLGVRYKCQFLGCTKSYASKVKLTDHQQAAHSNSTWTCEICNREFRNYRKLHEHRHHHRHPNLSEYRCDICEKYFKTLTALTNHQTASHFTSSHLCRFPGCSKMYMKKEHLTFHLQKKHPQWKGFPNAETQNSSSTDKSAVGDGTEAEMSTVEVCHILKYELINE